MFLVLKNQIYAEDRNVIMGYYDVDYNREVANERARKTVQLYEGWLVFLLSHIIAEEWALPRDMEEWWNNKKKATKEAKEREEREQARRRAKETGLAKLTLDEREALGFGRGPDVKLGNRGY